MQIENKIVEELKKEFITMLKSTGRDGVDSVLEELENEGFFIAPASTRFHGNYPGGLLEHSLNVAKCGLRLRQQLIEMKPEMADMVPEDSVIIASLLHDTCKCDIYKPTTKRVKNEYGVWVDQPGYDVDYSKFPVGHGEKSVILLLLWGLDLSDAEILAIRWHMSPWDLAFQSPEMKNCCNTARDVAPLTSLIRLADGMAANLIEWENKD